VADLWPGTLHQICQFHALREVRRLIFVLDQRTKAEMRVRLHQKTHEYRQNIHKRMQEARATKPARAEELAQLAVLEEYTAMVEATLNVESLAPFDYGGLAMQEALTHIQTSLERLEKKGRQPTTHARSDACRLKKIVSLQEEKRDVLAHIRAMRDWVMEVEHIFDGSWAIRTEEISNAEVGRRLDDWLHRLSTFLESDQRTEDEQLRLGHLLKVMTHLRSGLVQCYDREGFPRTNNYMERTIRAIKMHYRRISGRKNWNSYSTRLGQVCRVPRMVAAAPGWHCLFAGSLKTGGSGSISAGSARDSGSPSRTTQPLPLPPSATPLSPSA